MVARAFAVPTSRCALLSMFAVGIVAALPPAAHAQRSVMIEGARPEAHVSLGWMGEIGVGARVDIAILGDGFIHSLDDEFALSPGVELAFDDDGGGELALSGLLAAQWNFYVDASWSVFPELGIALVYRERDRGPARDETDVWLSPVGAVGGRYHFTRRNALVVRLAWPFGIQLGITF
jgi:hypothetical protein